MDIKDFVDKSFRFGLGLAVYSKEKIEAFIEDMVQRGEVPSQEAKAYADKLFQKGQEERDALRTLIREEVAQALKQAGIGSDDPPTD